MTNEQITHAAMLAGTQLANRMLDCRPADCACDNCTLAKAVRFLVDERAKLARTIKDCAAILRLNDLPATANAALDCLVGVVTP